LNISFLQHAY